MQSLVTEIGNDALDDKERMIIFFGDGATDHLKRYSVIQKFNEKLALDLKKDDKIKIDDKEYTVQHVGASANNNLNSIAHVTLIFDEVPEEDAITNGVYLTPHEIPHIHVGTVIDYLSN